MKSNQAKIHCQNLNKLQAIYLQALNDPNLLEEHSHEVIGEIQDHYLEEIKDSILETTEYSNLVAYKFKDKSEIRYNYTICSWEVILT